MIEGGEVSGWVEMLVMWCRVMISYGEGGVVVIVCVRGDFCRRIFRSWVGGVWMTFSISDVFSCGGVIVGGDSIVGCGISLSDFCRRICWSLMCSWVKCGDGDLSRCLIPCFVVCC